MSGGPLAGPGARPQEVARIEAQAVRLTGASARAVGADADLVVRGPHWYVRGQRVLARAPHVHTDIHRDDWSGIRGGSDAIALLVRHSDPVLRERAGLDGDVARLVFALLEQLRVEALADPALPGVAANLGHRFAAWSQQLVAAGLLESEQGLLLFTLAHIARSRILIEPIPESVEDLIEPMRYAIGAQVGRELIRLRELRGDQAAYGRVAEQVARLLAEQVDRARARAGGPVDTDEHAPERAEDRAISLLAGFEDDAESPLPVAALGSSRTFVEHGGRYAVFTRAHDRVTPGHRLLPAAALPGLRREVADLVRDSGLHVGLLTRQAAAALGTTVERGWDRGGEDGELDPGLLTRLVAHPGDRRVFRERHAQNTIDVAVTILIDMSGSMKPHRLRLVPLLAVLARAVRRAGAQVEVLGHTTVTWGGALARRDWQRAGRPPRPGRLSELQHIVLLDGGAPAARGRDWPAALLRTSLYREGVDGEALTWAMERLAHTEAARRLLLVVSDGSPMETSTARANDQHYLDQHLRAVVDAGPAGIEVVGLGVGLDLSAFYDDYAILDLTEPLPHVASQVLAVLGRPSRRRGMAPAGAHSASRQPRL